MHAHDNSVCPRCCTSSMELTLRFTQHTILSIIHMTMLKLRSVCQCFFSRACPKTLCDCRFIRTASSFFLFPPGLYTFKNIRCLLLRQLMCICNRLSMAKVCLMYYKDFSATKMSRLNWSFNMVCALIVVLIAAYHRFDIEIQAMPMRKKVKCSHLPQMPPNSFCQVILSMGILGGGFATLQVNESSADWRQRLLSTFHELNQSQFLHNFSLSRWLLITSSTKILKLVGQFDFAQNINDAPFLSYHIHPILGYTIFVIIFLLIPFAVIVCNSKQKCIFPSPLIRFSIRKPSAIHQLVVCCFTTPIRDNREHIMHGTASMFQPINNDVAFVIIKQI